MSQVVAITGASAGVGRATARRFAERGARIALIARGETGLAAAAREVTERGGEPMVLPLDISDADAVQTAVDRIEAAWGPIDVWVNAAFSGAFARFTDIRPEEYRRVTEVTYLGYVYGTMAALRSMQQRNRGTIVQVGSALAYRGIPLQTAYCGAKHAIQGFTESLRCELIHDHRGIRLTMVQLPALNTPQFSWLLSRLPRQAQPVPPIYQPEVAARAITYAADHPRRREYWVGRSTLLALVANRIAPGALDRYLARTGLSAQQTSQDRDPDQPVNLWQPADGSDGHDFGAHGAFDDRARSTEPQAWLGRHRVLVAGVAGTAAAAGAAVTRLTRTRR
ncbi:MAG TPA: SDR family oxidoreductase [Microlunatus sp.]